MASCFGFSIVSVCFQLLSIPAGAQSFFHFSGVVDAFHYLCGRFAVISLTLIVLLHWFSSELSFYTSVPLRAIIITNVL